MNYVLSAKTLDFVARTFYNSIQEHISNTMMEKFNVRILKRADAWCESVNQTWDSIPECPMMNRDGCRPIQRIIELAFWATWVATRDNLSSLLRDERFVYF